MNEQWQQLAMLGDHLSMYQPKHSRKRGSPSTRLENSENAIRVMKSLDPAGHFDKLERDVSRGSLIRVRATAAFLLQYPWRHMELMLDRYAEAWGKGIVRSYMKVDSPEFRWCLAGAREDRRPRLCRCPECSLARGQVKGAREERKRVDAVFRYALVRLQSMESRVF